jgi:uncharacterized linocin/CFP29 family protein
MPEAQINLEEAVADNFGRDKLWTPQTWADIDKAVMAEVGRLRVAQKVFEGHAEDGAPNVSADILVGGAVLAIQEGLTLPFMEIWSEFALTKGQVDNEATLHTGRRLALLAARSVALSEDLIIFQGGAAQIPGNANNAAANVGLINLPNIAQVNVLPIANQLPAIWGSNTFDQVAAGIAALVAAGHPGPYALFLPTPVHADTLITIGNATTTFDRVSALVEGRIYSTPALPVNPNTAILVSLGGSPTTLHVAQEAITAFTQMDQQGAYRFRVFERVQIVAREVAAFRRLDFQNPGAEAQQPQGGGRGHGRGQ